MQGIEIRLLSAEFEQALADFFSDIQARGDDKFFHPHPFSPAEAQRRASYTGKDLYYVVSTSERQIAAYGMLRGWDEGYTIPSLGIIVHSAWRGKGIGYLFMRFLHQAAKENGANQIRLKVYPSNTAARSLYEKLGYVFQNELVDDQLIAHKELV